MAFRIRRLWRTQCKKNLADGFLCHTLYILYHTICSVDVYIRVLILPISAFTLLLFIFVLSYYWVIFLPESVKFWWLSIPIMPGLSDSDSTPLILFIQIPAPTPLSAPDLTLIKCFDNMLSSSGNTNSFTSYIHGPRVPWYYRSIYHSRH